jgi:hypothetical protein
VLSLRARSQALRCAVCHDDLVAAESTCPLCKAAFHFECSAGLGGCSTQGCAHRSGRVVFSSRPARASRLRGCVGLAFVVGGFLYSVVFVAKKAQEDRLRSIETQQELESLANLRRGRAPLYPWLYVPDAWGHPIQYRENENGWAFWSCGEDGVDNGGRGDDILVSGHR